jgi:hypothetical protein
MTAIIRLRTNESCSERKSFEKTYAIIRTIIFNPRGYIRNFGISRELNAIMKLKIGSKTTWQFEKWEKSEFSK